MAALLHVLLIVSPAILVEEQKPGRAICRLEINSPSISLSEELRLNMIIEGPAPVDVDLPQPLTRSTDWRVRALPPRTSPLPDGREHWEQQFVFEPYQVGKVGLKLEPIQFRTGNEVLEWPLTWKPLQIQVVSMVTDPDREAARPVTGIEELPPAPSRTRQWYWSLLAIPAAAALILLGWRWRTRSSVVSTSPEERALLELQKLERSDALAPEQLPQLADILRRFLESRLPLAATRQTTSEFLISLRQVEGVDEKFVEKVGEVLSLCDLVKFAGAVPDHSTCQTLLRNVRDAIAQMGQPGRTSPAA